MCAARYARGTRLNLINILMAMRATPIRQNLDQSARSKSLVAESIMFVMSVRLGSRVMRTLVRIVVRRSVMKLNEFRTCDINPTNVWLGIFS